MDNRKTTQKKTKTKTDYDLQNNAQKTKIKIEKHEPHYKTWVNSAAPYG